MFTGNNIWTEALNRVRVRRSQKARDLEGNYPEVNKKLLLSIDESLAHLVELQNKSRHNTRQKLRNQAISAYKQVDIAHPINSIICSVLRGTFYIYLKPVTDASEIPDFYVGPSIVPQQIDFPEIMPGTIQKVTIMTSPNSNTSGDGSFWFMRF